MERLHTDREHKWLRARDIIRFTCLQRLRHYQEDTQTHRHTDTFCYKHCTDSWTQIITFTKVLIQHTDTQPHSHIQTTPHRHIPLQNTAQTVKHTDSHTYKDLDTTKKTHRHTDTFCCKHCTDSWTQTITFTKVLTQQEDTQTHSHIQITSHRDIALHNTAQTHRQSHLYRFTHRLDYNHRDAQIRPGYTTNKTCRELQVQSRL